jgi:hypothetical protein
MRDVRRLSMVLLVTLLLGVACSGDDDPSVRPEDSPAPPASTPADETPEVTPSPSISEVATGCANEGDALSSARSTDRMLQGDVDGDGDGDRVAIVIDREAEEARCRAFIVVMNRFGSFPATIEQEGMSFDVGFPALVSLAEIDGAPGLDIVMYMIAGASTQFAGVYTAHDGIPERLTFAQPSEFGDLFPTGGSVGHLEASDCVGPGAIVITTAVPKADDYKVSRTAYVVVEGQLEPQEEGASTARIPTDDLQTYPEFAASPFGSCPAG